MESKNSSKAQEESPFWTSPAVFVDHFLAPFYKTNTTGSFGKLWSSILLTVCLWFWLHLLRDIPQTLEAMLYALLAYTFGTKGVQIVRSKMASSKVTPAKPSQPSPAADQLPPQENEG